MHSLMAAGRNGGSGRYATLLERSGEEDEGQSSEARERGEYEDAGLCDALLRVSAAHTRLLI